MNILLWRSLHIIAMTAWFSGLFYLPRLFVYHVVASDKISIDRFKVMERRLYYGITWPSAIFTTGCGLWLLHSLPGLLQAPWMHFKLLLVAFLWCYHLFCGYYVRRFANDQVARGHVYFRWFNEVPVVFLVGIVFLVVMQPQFF